VIVVPRQKQYGEVIDDHEFELASALSNREDVLLVREISKLETTISQLDIAEIEESIGTSADLSRYLSKYLNELSRSGGL
jgi:UDP-N-acetylglucosamine transferase subunit ALG13